MVGITISLLAWFNPLGLAMPMRIALFILGFDMMGVIVKILIFWFNFAFPAFGDGFSYFSWTLLVLLFSEMLAVALSVDRMYRLIVKPAIVFAAVFISLGFQLALVIAGIDLLMNLAHKIKRDWKPGEKKPKKEKGEHLKKPRNGTASKSQKGRGRITR
jgi:hypothetical protein